MQPVISDENISQEAVEVRSKLTNLMADTLLTLANTKSISYERGRCNYFPSLRSLEKRGLIKGVVVIEDKLSSLAAEMTPLGEMVLNIIANDIFDEVGDEQKLRSTCIDAIRYVAGEPADGLSIHIKCGITIISLICDICIDNGKLGFLAVKLAMRYNLDIETP